MTKITEQEMKVWMAMENRYYSDKEVLDVRTDRMVGVRVIVTGKQALP